MVQDRSSKQSSAPAPDEDIEFEPTLSADLAQVLGKSAEPCDDGEYVRDDELMSGEAPSYAGNPIHEPLHQQSTSGHRDESPRRSVPPPLRRSAEVPKAQLFSDASSELNGRAALPRPNREFAPEPPTTVHWRSSVPLISDPVRGQSTPSSAVPSQVLERRRVRKDIIREGDILLGKLRIETVAAEGLIVTAHATHVHLNSRYQVVLLSPLGHGFSVAQDHFMRTARAVALMQSEHIAKVTEIGVLESGAPFLVAEMAGNADLAEVIRVRGPFGLTDAVECTIQIAEALAEAHSKGVIHGSLRPSCLRVIDGMDGWPLLKVLGFGTMAQWFLNTTSIRSLGRRTASETLPYLSPEQIRSPSDVDARTDIWSLGALLHEMLVGWPLYQAETPAALLAMIAADPPPVISAVRPDVPRQLETVILRCLQKDKASRFAGVADLARALQPFAPATSQVVIERIIRIMARGAASVSTYGRSNSAIVHMRNPSAGSNTYEAKASLKPERSFHFGLVAGGVVVLGAIAGILGAAVATRYLRPTQPLAAERLSVEQERAKPQSEAILQTQTYAAHPAAPPSAVVPALSSAVAEPPAAPAPVTTSHARAQAVAATSGLKSSSQVTKVAGLSREMRAEKPESAPAKKAAADLFSDMK